MIRFCFHQIALFLEEAGLPNEAVPVDTSKGLFIASELGPFSGQALHFQHEVPQNPAMAR